jgi:hypothetical protein
MLKKDFWVRPAALTLAVLLAVALLAGCENAANPPLEPQPPAKPVITSVLSGDASLTVNWNAAAYATSYELYFNEDENSPPTSGTAGITMNVTISETTATITNLDNSTSYYVWVRAKNSVGVSEYSTSALETPREAEIADLTTLLDGWYKGNALPPDDDGYERDGEIITYYKDGDKTVGFAGRALKYDPTGKVLIIQITNGGSLGKTVGKYYGLYIGDITAFSFTGASAYKDGGSGNDGMDTLAGAQTEYIDANSYFSITAGYGRTGVSAVVGLDTSLEASWAAVPGATGYDLYFTDTATQPTGSTNGITTNVTITETTATITSLANDTVYKVWIRAKDNSDTGVWVYQGSAAPEAVTIPSDLAKYFQSEPWSPAYAYYDDGFAVDSTTKTFYYYSDSTFNTKWKGFVVKIVSDGDASIMIIEITAVTGSWYSTPPAVGKYFAAAYKNPTSFAVSSTTAYKAIDGKNTGVDTITEAISEYTTANGYYPATYPLYQVHTTSAETLAALQGNWYQSDSDEGDSDYRISIRGTKLTEWLDDSDGIYNATDDSDMLAELGDIVDSTDASQASGVLYAKVIASDFGISSGKYFAVGWKSLSGDGVKFMTNFGGVATGNAGYDSLEAVKAALNDVNNTGQFEDDGFWDYSK